MGQQTLMSDAKKHTAHRHYPGRGILRIIITNTVSASASCWQAQAVMLPVCARCSITSLHMLYILADVDQNKTKPGHMAKVHDTTCSQTQLVPLQLLPVTGALSCCAALLDTVPVAPNRGRTNSACSML
jgi:hypothetical protein